MEFGMPTLIELKSLEACAKLCKELGLQFIELNMNLPEYQADRMEADIFMEIAQRYGIYYTIHLDEKLSPCDFNERIAQAYTDTVIHTIEAAKRLHVPVLNMHLSMGVYFTLPEERVYLFNEYRETYLAKLTAFRDQCEKAIGEADIRICVENSDGYREEFAKSSLALLLESKVFALTFDIGHNAAIGGGDEEIIMENKDRLCHMHDAKGMRNHLPLGTGELDLPGYVELADKQNCRVVLETKNVAGLKESAEWIKRRKLGM
ncbi:sugar phosphate isomerase/epimerase family protein [Anaerotaenia torta]|uniref:sugar phosphate isomerase/epimerase family protein n=1 Tax=Anaerotaenia torta TaxID=433293 RepID=UPI003D212CFB